MTKRMRTLIVAAGASLLAGFAAPAAAQVSVAATTPEIAALVREVGGERVEVEAIAKPLQDPHYVDAKPSFMVRLNRARALFFNGLELEVGWLPLLVQGARNPDLVTVELSAGIQVREKPAGGVSRAEGDVHPLGNPHYWLDPRNGRIMARTVAETLARLDPEGADAYEARLADFEARLDEELARWEAALAPHRGTPIVDHHTYWVYFAAWAGLEVANRVEAKPGIPPTAAHVRSLIGQIRRDGIPLLLQPNYIEPKVATFIADKSGITLLRLPATVGGEPEIETWWDFFDVVVGRVTSALAAN